MVWRYEVQQYETENGTRTARVKVYPSVHSMEQELVQMFLTHFESAALAVDVPYSSEGKNIEIRWIRAQLEQEAAHKKGWSAASEAALALEAAQEKAAQEAKEAAEALQAAKEQAARDAKKDLEEAEKQATREAYLKDQ